MPKDYYKILAIPRNTESAQIKQKAQNVLDKAKKEYETNLMAIKKAYFVIANSVRRQDYDRKLKAEYGIHKNFYKILRISPNTDQRLVKELTQDTVNTVKQEYESKIAEIKEAYSVIGNIQKRAAYDNTRLQEEKQRETLRRRRQATRLNTQRSFSLRELILPALLIGLIYFGYTKYQEDAALPANQPSGSKDSRIAATPFPPSTDIPVPYSDEEFQADQPTPSPPDSWEEPEIFQPPIPSPPDSWEEPEVVQPEESQPVYSSSNLWEEAEKLQAEEKQPAPLSSYLWEEGAQGYETIMTTAHSSEEPVIVYFLADWCPWCKKLGRNYFTHYEFKNFLNNILRVKITPDNSTEEKQLFKQYKGTGYPSIFIYVPAFKSRPTKMYPFREGEDWSPEEFMHELRDHIVWVYNNHAYNYVNNGQYEEARYYYRKALLYNRENAHIFYSIGLTYHKDGYERRDVKRLLLAKASYLEALKYEPNHQESLNSLKRLKNF
jgi:thiol-disulfide isomerase/thioredoxin